MLSVTSFSLIIPGLEAAKVNTGSPSLGAFIVALGILLGAAFLRASDKFIPHEHFFFCPENVDQKHNRRVWLFILAITLHNLPEGLAVGVGFGGENFTHGEPLAIGIALQNMPEGLVVAISLIAIGWDKWRSIWISFLTGMVEPIGALAGSSAMMISKPIMPWGMAFAAGAMLYVVSHEIIPETHRKGFENEATAGIMFGFVAMLLIETLI
jgi:ZIP family zinc transporter